MRMQTVRGTSIMRPTRSIASPAVTSISRSAGPTQVQAGVGGLPSSVVAPTAVLHTGEVPPAVNVAVPLRICTLPLESTMADGDGKGALGRHPFALIGPSLVHTMPVPSVTVSPGVAENAGAVPPLTPATPVFTCTF